MMPTEENTFAKTKRDFNSIKSGKSVSSGGNSTTMTEQKVDGVDVEELDREVWNKNPHSPKELVNKASGNAANSHRSRVSKGNHAQFHELWISKTQARLIYDQENIDLLIQDFLSDVGQMQPIKVCEKVNPENPAQHLNVTVGHNRYKAWEEIYTNPKYAHLVADKAWVDKHRPSVALDDVQDDFDLLVRQSRENTIRNNLTPWEVCVIACRLMKMSEEKGVTLKARTALRDHVGIKTDLAYYGDVCNTVIEGNYLEEEDFDKTFAEYRIKGPRVIKSFFRVYEFALGKGVVNNLKEWMKYLNAQGFLEVAQKPNTQVLAFLATRFDDYIPSADESVASEELKRRFNAARAAAEKEVEAATTPQTTPEPVVNAVAVENKPAPVTDAPIQQPAAGITPEPVVVEQPMVAKVEPEAKSAPVVETAVQAPVVEVKPAQVEAAQPEPAPVAQPTAPQVQKVTIKATDTEEEEVPADQSANKFSSEALFEVLSEGTNSQIAAHFKALFKDADDVELGLYLRKLYNRLGDDFIEDTKNSFY